MVVVIVILAIIAVLIIGAVIYTVVIFNGLVRLKNNIVRNWSNIDVLLKQRFDEIPKLLTVCEGYLKHERSTLEAVTKARAVVSQTREDGDDADSFAAQNAISSALRSLFAVVENYPDLKADQAFLRLQNRISELEDQIADRREFYNESINLYNIGIEQFPDVMVARMVGYVRRPPLENRAEHARRGAPWDKAVVEQCRRKCG